MGSPIEKTDPDPVTISKPERDLATYFADRVQYKINTYQRLARRYRNVYWAVASTSAIGAVLVPALINLPVSQMIPTVVSLIVAILVALERVFRPREHWRNYDLISALLREEEMRFSTRSGDYAPGKLAKDEDPFSKFVQRVEDAIRREREETIVMRTTEDSAPTTDR